MHLRAPAMVTDDDDEVIKDQLTASMMFLLPSGFFFCTNKNKRKSVFFWAGVCTRAFHREFPLFLLTDYLRAILNFQQTEKLY